MKLNSELTKYLLPYNRAIEEVVMELRDFVTELFPEANELIWDNYNAVALAYSKSEKLQDAFCHISVYSGHVNFGFNRGAELPKSDLKLKGSGKLIRHLTVKHMSSFPKELVEKLLYEAVGISEKLNEDLLLKEKAGRSIVMSISEKKVRPSKNDR